MGIRRGHAGTLNAVSVAEVEERARVEFAELLEAIEVLELQGNATIEVTSLEHDSARVEPGACFACIPGRRTDGHLHAPAAVAAGAVALLVERPLGLGVAEAQVSSVRAALGPTASKLAGDPSRSMRCLGVTGTNGKTTTTFLVESIVRAAGERVGVIGTIGARLHDETISIDHTTPEATRLQALLAHMRDASVSTVVLEVSSHALAQRRVDGTWFAAVGFTNLSHDHLDYHGSFERYFEAKASLFDPARAGAAASNVDDPFGEEIARRCRRVGLPLVAYGTGPDSDLLAEQVELATDRTTFVLADRRTGARAGVALSLLGACNVSNALGAAATALAGGFPFEAVVAGLSAPLVVPGRLEAVQSDLPFTVLVDFAHTPAALTAALNAARVVAGEHRVLLVFGCGGDRDRAKRPLMGEAAAADADVVVLTSDNPRSEDPRSIVDAVLEGAGSALVPAIVELDRRSALRIAFSSARPGDVVLVAGKGHEQGQTIGNVMVPFDDRAVAREELEALACS